MFWSLDLDDFTGLICSKGKYPLINKAKQKWLKKSNRIELH